METPTVIALIIVGLVVIGGVYIATRPSTAAGGPALGDGGGLGGGTPEGAAYITAGANGAAALISSIGSLYGASQRQAGGASAGAAK
jgi:hypothetical protein